MDQTESAHSTRCNDLLQRCVVILCDFIIRLINFQMFIFLISLLLSVFFFFFNDTATTEIYTLSLHDALPISIGANLPTAPALMGNTVLWKPADRKGTRLNSSHQKISYAVFCLKKKKEKR